MEIVHLVSMLTGQGNLSKAVLVNGSSQFFFLGVWSAVYKTCFKLYLSVGLLTNSLVAK